MFYKNQQVKDKVSQIITVLRSFFSREEASQNNGTAGEGALQTHDFATLPPELLQQIASYLANPKDVVRLFQLSTALNELFSNEAFLKEIDFEKNYLQYQDARNTNIINSMPGPSANKSPNSTLFILLYSLENQENISNKREYYSEAPNDLDKKNAFANQLLSMYNSNPLDLSMGIKLNFTAQPGWQITITDTSTYVGINKDIKPKSIKPANAILIFPKDQAEAEQMIKEIRAVTADKSIYIKTENGNDYKELLGPHVYLISRKHHDVREILTHILVSEFRAQNQAQENLQITPSLR